jgi:16S rRNA (cytidine1402-2'-O)-methyltransferase
MLNIVGTPIGNMQDITLRAARTLIESDIILAEDTRSSGILLKRVRETYAPFMNEWHDAAPRFISYYKDNEFGKLPEVIAHLEAGKNISIISESGMPVVSDPGYLLVKEAIKRNIKIDVIPGATALIHALIASGLAPHPFMFLGFFPKKTNEFTKLLEQAKVTTAAYRGMTFIAYESPHRLQETLELMEKVVPTAQVCICRELTKKFEEISRGTPAELKTRTYRGEIVLVFSV